MYCSLFIEFMHDFMSKTDEISYNEEINPYVTSHLFTKHKFSFMKTLICKGVLDEHQQCLNGQMLISSNINYKSLCLVEKQDARTSSLLLEQSSAHLSLVSFVRFVLAL